MVIWRFHLKNSLACLWAEVLFWAKLSYELAYLVRYTVFVQIEAPACICLESSLGSAYVYETVIYSRPAFILMRGLNQESL